MKAKITSNNDKISKNDIVLFENKWNLKIPKDYKNFLLKFNGGEAYPEYFPEKKETTHRLLYFLDLNEMESYYEREFELIPENFIVIGIIDGNDWLFISTKLNTLGKIYLGDSNTCRGAEEDDLEFISDSFTNFLNIFVEEPDY